MIFGETPRIMNQRTDLLGRSMHTMAPSTLAIMQASNLFVYTMNNPVMFLDPSGEFAITSTLLLIAAAWVVTTTGAMLAVDHAMHGNQSIAGRAASAIVSTFSSVRQAVSVAIQTAPPDSAPVASNVGQPESSTVTQARPRDTSRGINPTATDQSTPANPDPGDPQGRRNWQRVGEKWLKKNLREQGLDPHALKREYLGQKAPVSFYDIFVDKSTGQLAIFEQSTGRLVQITSYFIP